jgi:RimJ/RimL family protein N-acetyltransferase
VRGLGAAHWQALRDLRLHALRTEPGLFFRSYDEEARLSDADWIALAAGDESRRVFGAFDAEHLIGISAVTTDRDDPTGRTASLGMSYIVPAYRRAGLGSRFYEARLAWARARPHFVRVVVGHRRSNEASRRAIERFGFRHTFDLPHRWPDGTDEDDVCYELILRDT